MSLTGQTGVSHFFIFPGIQKISSSKSFIFGGMHGKEMRREEEQKSWTLEAKVRP